MIADGDADLVMQQRVCWKRRERPVSEMCMCIQAAKILPQDILQQSDRAAHIAVTLAMGRVANGIAVTPYQRRHLLHHVRLHLDGRARDSDRTALQYLERWEAQRRHIDARIAHHSLADQQAAYVFSGTHLGYPVHLQR